MGTASPILDSSPSPSSGKPQDLDDDDFISLDDLASEDGLTEIATRAPSSEVSATNKPTKLGRKSVSTRYTYIGDLFSAVLDAFVEIIIKVEKGIQPEARKGIINDIGMMRIWLYDLQTDRARLEAYLATSDRMRTVMFAIIYRLVRLVRNTATSVPTRPNDFRSARFRLFELDILEACPTLEIPKENNPRSQSDGLPKKRGIPNSFENDGSQIRIESHDIQEHCSSVDLEPSDSDTESDDDEGTTLDESETESEKNIIQSIQKRLSAIRDDFSSLSNTLLKCMQLARHEGDGLKHYENIKDFKIKRTPTDYIEGNLRDRFPLAKDYLITRIAKECWYLHRSIRKGLEEREKMKELAQGDDDSAYGSPASFMSISLIDGIKDEETVKKDELDLSNTFPAKSVAASTATGDFGDRPKEPKPPVGFGRGKPFMCNICSQSLRTINNRKDWRKHVLSDIRPFICTFEECSSVSHRYPDRISWLKHQEAHNLPHSNIQCMVYNCDTYVDSKDDLQEHLDRTHFPISNINASQYNALEALGICKTRAQLRLWRRCPLCNDELSSNPFGAGQHVARHFEDIALPILTAHMEVGDVEGGGNIDPNLLKSKQKPELDIEFPSRYRSETQSPQGESPHTRPRRTLKKCAQCRRNREKCLPVDRKWPERCERCTKSGYQCSPILLKSPQPIDEYPIYDSTDAGDK